MENIRIGSFIRERRKNLGLTQEQVCDGICDPVSLSRIENNKQTPGRAILDALMQRLGMPDSRYYILSSPEELAIDGLKRKIIACNVTRNAALGFAKVAELQKLTSPGDHLTRQFILRAKAVLEDIDGSYSALIWITFKSACIPWMKSRSLRRLPTYIRILANMKKQLAFSASCWNT